MKENRCEATTLTGERCHNPIFFDGKCIQHWQIELRKREQISKRKY
jgi:hypothetical protein